MKHKIVFGFITVCSIALNIAFVTMWLIHAAPRLALTQQCCNTELDGCRKCPMQKTLDITDSQWNVLKPGVETYRRMVDSLQHEIVTAREAMLTELAATPTDTASISAYRDRILAGQRKMQEQVIANVLEQKAVLTPGQHLRFIEKVRSDMFCGSEPGMAGACRRTTGKDNCCK